eukprot:3551843-Rhodomonas_salina.2
MRAVATLEWGEQESIHLIVCRLDCCRFHRFARGAKRKRFTGYEKKKLQKQGVQSMDLSEL